MLLVMVLRRSLVAYVELMVISVWESEEALARFTESEIVCDPADSACSECGAVRLEARVFELLPHGEALDTRAEGLSG